MKIVGGSAWRVLATMGLTLSPCVWAGTTPVEVLIFGTREPMYQGGTVYFVANIAGVDEAPTGTVDFLVNGGAFPEASFPSAFCRDVPVSSGMAVCHTSQLPIRNNHSVRAEYSGDAIYAPGASPFFIQQVYGVSPLVDLPMTVSVSPSAVSTSGQPLSVTATSTSSITPAGWVDMRMGPYDIAGCTGLAWSPSGASTYRAQCLTSALPVGEWEISAQYASTSTTYNSSRNTNTWRQTVRGGTNVALAINGARASASSDQGLPFSSIAAAIDGDRLGTNWGSGGGWEDATYDAYPDWVQVDFDGFKTIDRVGVFSLRDDYYIARQPTGNFSYYGVADFSIQAWSGAAWVTLATVTGNRQEWREVTFPAISTDRIRVNVTHALYYKSRIVEIEAWGAAAGITNVATMSAGAEVVASSEYGLPFASKDAIIADIPGAKPWGAGAGWEDDTFNAYPDWVEIRFPVFKTLSHVVICTLPDGFSTACSSEFEQHPDLGKFNYYGIVDYSVDAWSGTGWVALASVVGNFKNRRTHVFTPYTTDRVRVNVTRAMLFKSRLVRVEAWGLPNAALARSNVALASAGAVATASSSYPAPFSSVAAVNDGERRGVNWGNGGGWEDNTYDMYSDLVTIDFAGTKTIDRVVLYTLRDNYSAPGEPADGETFTSYGIVDFSIEGWNGLGWVPLAFVSNNNQVKRTVDFAPFATDRIRVNVTRALYFKSRIVEVEAWGS